MMILNVKNLSKYYTPNKFVLNELNLSINEGEIIAIKGASGSGKSTLLNIIGFIDSASSGDIKFKSKKVDMYSFENNRSSNIGFLFQFHHLLPEFTVKENILIPTLTLKTSDNYDSICNALLKELGILHLKDKFPSQISGGERQRVAFLRSIICKPSIVIADEPTGNLDESNTLLLLDLIREYKNKFNISFVIATHDEKVSEISDRILLLENGKLTQV